MKRLPALSLKQGPSTQISLMPLQDLKALFDRKMQVMERVEFLEKEKENEKMATPKTK